MAQGWIASNTLTISRLPSVSDPGRYRTEGKAAARDPNRGDPNVKSSLSPTAKSFDTIFGPLIHSAFVASAGAAVGVRADT